MYNLLALIAFFFVSQAFASYEFTSRYTAENVGNDTATVAAAQDQKVDSKTFSLELSKVDINKYQKLGFSFANSQKNYDQYLVYKKDGSYYPLSRDYDGNESQATLTLTSSYKKHILEASAGGTISSSPLRTQKQSADYIYLLNTYENIGMTAQHTSLDRPTSYFINRDLKSESRPNELNTYSGSLNYERIWNSRYKSKILLSAGQRIEDRPFYYGPELRNLIILGEFTRLRIDTGYLTEDHSNSLKDERGYLDSYWLHGMVSYDVTAHSTVGLGYALDLDRERNIFPTGMTQTIGSDSVVSSYSYEGREFTLSFDTAYAFFNTGQRGFIFSGGLLWNI
jgi:hypothetical protein